MYGVKITNAGAASWRSQVIFCAPTPDEATLLLRATNLYKRLIEGHLREDDLRGMAGFLLARTPARCFSASFDDEGWTPWMRLPRLQHSAQGLPANRLELHWPLAPTCSALDPQDVGVSFLPVTDGAAGRHPSTRCCRGGAVEELLQLGVEVPPDR